MPHPLDPIFRPRSIAIVGASRSPNTIGHQVLSNLLRFGYTGVAYPVNPKAASIHSIRAWPSVSAIPDPVDMAVVVVPKQFVLDVVRDCGEKGVKGLVVISAGFREVGGEGVQRERDLMGIVRQYDMRLVGPNCMGVLNADPSFAMNATFAPSMPPFGHAAFVSQSGALGLSVLDYAQEYGIGIAQFVSMGNKPDVSGNDVLLYWEDDPAIGVILMYVESFGNPRRFLEIASRVTLKKPIVVVKSGRSKIGAQAASSHTGALATSDSATDALLAQAGVFRAETVEELFDLAMAFGCPALPRSRRTAVITNSGGPGILAADALEARDVDLTPLAPETVRRLKPLFPEEASLRNPLDMVASATPAGYRSALGAILADPQVDSAIAIFVPPLGIRQADVAEAVVSAAKTRDDKPVLAVLMGREGLPQGRAELHEVRIPAYIFPESAARGLEALCRYREWLDRPAPVDEDLPVDRARAEGILRTVQNEGRQKLSELEALELLAAYGIQTADAGLATSPDEAAELGDRFGYPVVMKVVSGDILHKTDVGGVRVGVDDASEARRAYAEIAERVRTHRPDAAIDGMLVQQMVQGGVETLIGLSHDPALGALVGFGLGGILVEALKDVVFRLVPIHRRDAADMLGGIRGHAVLDGVRGAPPADRRALEDILLRISRLAVDFPEIRELDLNPVMAFGDRAVAVDGRVLIE